MVFVYRGVEFAGVAPIGMGLGTLPAISRRPDLVDAELVQIVREKLYRELRRFSGFRRAMFGAECWDQMVFATSEEDADIDYSWMISSVQHFPCDPDNVTIDRYTDGYRIVTSNKPAI